MNHTSRFLIAGLLCALSVAVVGQQQPPVSVWGTVRDSAGKPVDGAVVSIRAVDQTFSTTVFTDDSGDYVMPPLSARRYRMWAQATGFNTARSDVVLAGRPVSQSF